MTNAQRRKGLRWAVLGTAFLAALIYGGTRQMPPRTVPFDVQPSVACASDDGSGPDDCVWDAAHLGDGHGQSFRRIGTVDGHPDCLAYIGPTSVLKCADGFEEES